MQLALKKVAALGFFDGVHLGHRHILHNVAVETWRQGASSMAVTFDRHPLEVVRPEYAPPLLTTTEERQRLIKSTGINECVVLPFDRDMSRLTAREFMEQVLRRRFGITTLILGYDSRFGCGRAEVFEDYLRYGEELGIEVQRATEYLDFGLKISSSLIRRMLRNGEVRMASECLGRCHAITGTVVKGKGNGTSLGFPTANIELSGEEQRKLVPPNGVYTIRAEIEGTMHPGMLNIGVRPTFNGTGRSIEAHVLDFSGNLYGRSLTIHFVDWMRPEQRFATVDDLKAQLAKDKARALKDVL